MFGMASNWAAIALVLAVSAGPAGAAGIDDILKKHGGKTSDQGGKEAEDGQVLAVKGAWTLTYDHNWSGVKKARIPICSIYTSTREADGLPASWIFYTRWEYKADRAEMAINWGPSVDDAPAELLLGGGRSEPLLIEQGVGFLVELVDKEVAEALSAMTTAKLSFKMKSGSQKKQVEQEFSLDGFDEAYGLLFSLCDPKDGFKPPQ